jgi:HD superfamily phosphodiesterase
MGTSFGYRTLVMAAALCIVVRATPAAAPVAAPSAPAAADWRAAVRDLAVKNFKNPAWGYSHCMRDYALARELAAADHAVLDDDVLFAAAYLHDLAAFKPWENEKLDHSDVAADKVDAILKGTGFPMAKIDAVRGAIRTHMYYRDPAGPEALYLHDADALDWLGAIGVARIIALVDPNGADPDGPKAVKMLEDNLKAVPSRVLSPAGKAMMPPRKAELEAFLGNLRRESDNLRTL